jgi:hypothetical protein
VLRRSLHTADMSPLSDVCSGPPEVRLTHSEHAGGPENNAFSNRAGFVAFVTDPNPPSVIAVGINSRTRFELKEKCRPSR